MTYVVVMAASAFADACELIDWWREGRAEAPNLLGDELAAAIARLGQAPRLGRVVRQTAGTVVRRVLLRRSRVHIYYVVNDVALTVEMVAVWHAMRDRDPWG